MLDFLFSDNPMKTIDLQTITHIELLSVVQRYLIESNSQQLRGHGTALRVVISSSKILN